MNLEVAAPGTAGLRRRVPVSGTATSEGPTPGISDAIEIGLPLFSIGYPKAHQSSDTFLA